MTPKLKPYPQPKRPIFAAPEGIPISEWSEIKGIKRTTLLMQLEKGYWKLLGPDGIKGPGAVIVERVWRFHKDAFLEFPERRPWGTVNKRKKAVGRGYPRTERKIKKR